MGAISAPDLVLLRQPVNTQKCVERLYSLGFDVVWTGRVNDAGIARGDRDIIYDAGVMAAGFAFADLQTYAAGLEVWFGSTSGGQERGRRRLRSMGAAVNVGTLAIDWYGDMQLSDDDYITIVHNYPAWPKYSWFTSVGPVFRKDGPDGYQYADVGDPNEAPAPLVIMGRHYAGELNGGPLTISFDATNSVDVAGGGGGPAYLWDITPPVNAAFDFDNIAAPTLTVTAAGKWWIHCQVTIDGRATTAHRAVIVGGGITEFSRSPITAKYDSTSLECQISSTSPDSGGGEIRPQVDWSDFEDHALVIITADEWYGSTNKSIDFRDDDVYDDRHHIVFCGYLVLENDDFQSTGAGQVQMSAVSLMDMFVYSLSLTGMASADQWYEMASPLMTVAGNLLHLFRWHSTLLDIADWWLPWTDTVRRSANEEFGEGDIVERARALARARVMGLTANPQGELFVETDLNTRSLADRNAETTTLTLTEADISGDKRVRIRRRGDVIRVMLDGGYSQGRLGTFQPFFSASQEVARAEGRPALVHLDRLMLPSQAEANRLSGRLAGIANRKYSEVNLEFSGNYREIFSPADQQWTNLGDVFASTLKSNLRGFDALEDVKVVPREVTHSHDNRAGVTNVSAIFDVEAPVELTGVTITYPEVPSENPYDGTWDFPEPPAFPAIPEITFSGSLVAFDLSEGCWVRYVDAADWEERDGGRAGTDDDDYQGGWDPWWFTPAKQNTSDPHSAILWACQVGHIWRSTDCGATWLDVTPADDPPNDWSDVTAPTVADVTFVQRTDNIHINSTHYFLARWLNVGAEARSWLLVTTDDGVTWTWYSLRDFASGGGCDAQYCYAGFSSIEHNESAEKLITVSGSWDSVDAGGSAATFEHVYKSLGGWLNYFDIICDLGFEAESDGIDFLTINVHVRADPENCTPLFPPGCCNNGFWETGGGGAANISYSSDGIAWTLCGGDGDWRRPNNNGAYAWEASAMTAVAGHTFRYIRLRSVPTAEAGDEDGWQMQIDSVRVEFVDNKTTGLADELYLIWADVDSEDGSTMYATVWYEDTLNLWIFDTSDFTAMPTVVALGACSKAQLGALTYVAYPHTPAFSKDYCYVFGRMNAPQALANPEHVIVTANGGVAWASIENGFGVDYVGALRAEGTTDAARTLYAIRNIAANPAKLYVDTEALTYMSDVPFTGGVYVDALTITPDGQVAVGSDATNDIHVTESPYAAWTDITGSYPGSSTSSLTYL